jgi:hypothetical protein
VTAQEIAIALGNATHEGRNWRCRCPLHDGVSLCLRDGRTNLLARCWNGCETADVLAELRRRGLLGDRPDESKPSPIHPKPIDTSNIEPAARIWAESVNPRGTLIERYLAARGLALPPGGEEAIRFHPQCPFKGERVPAMVALLRDIRTDDPCGIHRTALLSDGSDRDRALGKAMLGRAPAPQLRSHRMTR